MAIKIEADQIATGRTTRALRELRQNGGGIFITQNPQELGVLAKHIGLSPEDNIQIVQIPRGSNIVIDDSDNLDIVVVVTTR